MPLEIPVQAATTAMPAAAVPEIAPEHRAEARGTAIMSVASPEAPVQGAQPVGSISVPGAGGSKLVHGVAPEAAGRP